MNYGTISMYGTAQKVHALYKQENIHCMLACALEVDDVSIARMYVCPCNWQGMLPASPIS